MHTCESCGSKLPDHASFCGACGYASSDHDRLPTEIKELPSEYISASDAVTTLSASPLSPQQDRSSSDAIAMLKTLPLSPQQDRSSSDAITTLKTSPLIPQQGSQSTGGQVASEYATVIDHSEEEEEERRRRLALLGSPLLLLADGQFAKDAPVVQGTPQWGNAPTVQGTPYPGGGPVTPPTPNNLYSPPGTGIPGGMPPPPLVLPAPPNVPPVSSIPSGPPTPQPTSGTNASGCLTWLIVVILPLIILASIFGVGLIVFTPTLTLSSGTNVVIGGSFHLHGSNFIQGSTVTLVLDNTIPLLFTSGLAPSQLAYTEQSNVALGAFTQHIGQIPNPQNTVKVSGDGTFDVTITVDKSWSVGTHTIRATESFSSRSVIRSFNVSMPGQTPTPTATTTPTASPSPSPPSATPTTTLSTVNPSMVSLGPISEGYNQALSSR